MSFSNTGVAGPDGFVGVGPDSTGNDVLWRSTDGSIWHCVRGVPRGSGCTKAVLGTYPENGKGYETTVGLIRSDGTRRGSIAMGCAQNYGDSCGASGTWHSVDGTKWRPARIVGLPTDLPDHALNDVAVNDGRMVAVGTAALCHGGNGSCDWQSALLTSTDGVTWRPVSGVLDPAGVTWSGLRAAGGGGFIAAGNVTDADGNGGTAVVWTSPDGQTWGRGTELPDFAKGQPVLVAGGGPGYVVAGNTADGWGVRTSADGVQWSTAPDQPAFMGANVDGIVGTPSGLVAIGRVRANVDETGNGGLALWTSTDGLTWVLGADQPPSDMSGKGIAADGQRVVVLMCEVTRCATWTSPLPR